MKALRISTILPILWLINLTLACSVGTEVGNGVKPSDPQSPATAANSSSPGPTVGDAATTSTVASGAANTAPGAPVSSTVATNAAGTGATFDPSLDRIFANCASPFGSATIATPIVLSHKNTVGTRTTRDNKITAAFTSGSQTWKISDANANLYRQLILDQTHGPQAVIAYDAGFHALSSGFTCSGVATDSAAMITGSTLVYTKLSVSLTDATGQIFPLSWYLLAPGAGAPMQLKRIEIGPSNSSAAFVLETE